MYKREQRKQEETRDDLMSARRHGQYLKITIGEFKQTPAMVS
jgi:hypothetical protein